MVNASADVTLPVDPGEAYAAILDLEDADWLPGVRRLRHIGGPREGEGARYEVEAGILGRHLRGVLTCTDATKPKQVVVELEEGLDLKITAKIRKVSGGCHLELAARYSVGGGPLGGVAERASQGAARREVARAVEQFAARFGRKDEEPAPAMARRRSPAS